jgi:hypothetical protein
MAGCQQQQNRCQAHCNPGWEHTKGAGGGVMVNLPFGDHGIHENGGLHEEMLCTSHQ